MKTSPVKKDVLTACFCFLLTGMQASAQQDNTKRLDNLFKEVAGDPAMHFNGTVLAAENGNIIYENSMALPT